MSLWIDSTVHASLLSSANNLLLAWSPPDPEGSKLNSGSRVHLLEYDIEVKLKGIVKHNLSYIIFEATGPPGVFERILLGVPVQYSRISVWHLLKRKFLERSNRLDDDFIVFVPREINQID